MYACLVRKCRVKICRILKLFGVGRYRLQSSCHPFQDFHLSLFSSPFANELAKTLQDSTMHQAGKAVSVATHIRQIYVYKYKKTLAYVYIYKIKLQAF